MHSFVSAPNIRFYVLALKLAVKRKRLLFVFY